MNDQQTKVLQRDSRSEKRLRFQSNKQRSKKASADVFRQSQSRIAGNRSSVREAAVHGNKDQRPQKRLKVGKLRDGRDGGSDTLIRIGTLDEAEQLAVEDIESNSFSVELDLALDRNPSEIFSSLHRKTWRLVRSLPEILHNAPQIVDHILNHMISLESHPEQPCQTAGDDRKNTDDDAAPAPAAERQVSIGGYVINHATSDCLHMLAVLARDLRQEIHPYLHVRILPTLFDDLLNVSGKYAKKQQNPIHAGIIESVFRTMAYVLRYDTAIDDKDLEKMRKYYGGSLGHRSELIRRLSSEVFAQLIRRQKRESAQQKHIKKVFRALLASESKSTTSPSTQRTFADIADGMAHLLFHVTRGASGSLHSKGQQMLTFVFELSLDPKSLLKNASSSEWKSCKIIFNILSSLLCRMCEKLKNTVSVSVVEAFIFASLKAIDGYKPTAQHLETEKPTKTKNEKKKKKGGDAEAQPTQTAISDFGLSGIQGILRLLRSIAKTGNQSCEHVLQTQRVGILSIARKILEYKLFDSFDGAGKIELVASICSIWQVCRINVGDVGDVRLFLRSIMQQLSCDTPSDADLQHVSSMTSEVLGELLPSIQSQTVTNAVFGEIMSTVAKAIRLRSKDGESRATTAASGASLNILLLLSQTLLYRFQSTSDDAFEDAGEDMDSMSQRSAQTISSWQSSPVNHKDKKCLVDHLTGHYNIKAGVDGQDWEGMSVAIRCLPSIILFGVDNENAATTSEHINQTIEWAHTILRQVPAFPSPDLIDDAATNRGPTDRPAHLITYQVIQTLCAILQVADTGREDVQVPFATVFPPKLKRQIEAAIFSASGSAMGMKCASLYMEMLGDHDETAGIEASTLIETLSENLRSPSHFLRLHTLRVLNGLPKLPLVVNFADLDMANDLDEDAETATDASAKKEDGGTMKPSSVAHGLCDALEVLLKIETTPITLSNEKVLSSLVSRVEVLARSGRLPELYAVAATNYMIGVFYIKFAPVWTFASQTVQALLQCHDSSAWPIVGAHLQNIAELLPGRSRTKIEPEDKAELLAKSSNFDACVRMESSCGLDISPSWFPSDTSKRRPTDELASFGSSWGVIKANPMTLSKHSRDLVPILLDFLGNQYYSYNDGDPEGRELHLDEHIEIKNYSKDELDGYALTKRLKILLGAFSVVQGPEQLLKRDVIQYVFRGFMTHQDTDISSLALAGFLKFKNSWPPSLPPLLKGLMKTAGFREVLLDFETSMKDQNISDEHRTQLVPIISRILFGRVTSKSGSSRQSKHSPAARRAAVLAVFSNICKHDEELHPFVYLMVRNFIPDGDHRMTPFEKHGQQDKDAIDKALHELTISKLTPSHGAVYIGYLNLLGTVITQLGHRIAGSIPTLTSIVIALCKVSEVKGKVQIQADANDPLVHAEGASADADSDQAHGSVNEASNAGIDDSNDTDIDANAGAGSTTVRMRSIRSLCFSRLSDVFNRFCGRMDLEHFSGPLWDSLHQSLIMLPEMTVASNGVPALLTLLTTMSSYTSTINMLSTNPATIEAVLKCIDRRCSPATITCCLRFVENLMDDTDDEGGRRTSGQTLVLSNLSLVFARFIDRLGGKARDADDSPNTPTNVGGNGSNRGRAHHSDTWRQELRILFKLSEAVISRTDMIPDDSALLEELLSLIVPLVEVRRSVTEADLLNALGIIRTLVPKIGERSALDTYFDLSTALAPKKGSTGLISLQIRQEISSIILTIANKQSGLRHVADTLGGLSAVSSKRVDELNLEIVIVHLAKLCSDDDQGESPWLSMLSGSEDDPTLLSPVVNACFHFIYDSDMVLARTAFSAIKHLIATGANQIEQEQNSSVDGPWQKYMESYIVPAIRNGFSSRNAAERRYFLLMIAEVARKFQSHPSQHLHGDLFCLCSDENPDVDFFQSITHVQLHRRARALKRLRETLRKQLAVASSSAAADDDDGGERKREVKTYSISNVLLPIVIHPVYEVATNAEETMAIEAIATAGVVAKTLSWSKYSALLWTSLRSFERNQQQERYIVGLVCSILDGFHFDVIRRLPARGEDWKSGDENAPAAAGDGDNINYEQTSVWRALERRLIPGVEGLLTKEKTDKHGTKTKTPRPAIVLALLKLYHKFPTEFFEMRLPRVLAILCDALKAKDSNIRDVGRSTIAKVSTSIDIKYLADVVRELAITLKEGYKLHVRSATVHTILLEVEKKYNDLVSSDEAGALELSKGLDHCVMPLMDIFQQDMFGVTQERKDSENRVSFVKEASGNKGVNGIEIVCRLVQFKPSQIQHATTGAPGGSAVHCIISPLLQRLRQPDVSAVTVRRIQEVLSRASIGFSKNRSITPEEALPFVYATLQPFITPESASRNGVGDGTAGEMHVDSDDDSSDDDDEADDDAIRVSGSKKSSKTKSKRKKSSKKAGSSSVVEWRPSVMKSTTTAKGAYGMKKKDKADLAKVQDGRSAPKLTGSGRHDGSQYTSTKSLDDPSSIAAVVFGLDLLNRCLKSLKTSPEMTDPYIPLLTSCVKTCRDNQVVFSAFKCLAILLRFDLPSTPSCAKILGTKSLESLVVAQASSKQNNDLIQVCFRNVTSLMKLAGEDFASGSGSGGNSKTNGMDLAAAVEAPLFPFDSEQMKMLILSIKRTIFEADQHHPALGLIKAVLSKRYISSELYDLMDDMLKVSVRSLKESLRQNSGRLFTRFLVDYPMGSVKFERYLKQLLSNVAYEYAEGRLSAIKLVDEVISQLPMELVDKNSNSMFLSLVLQMQNDESKECREALSSCLSNLFSRSSMDVLRSLLDYTKRWFDTKGPLKAAALQLFGLFIDARFDALQRGSHFDEVLSHVHATLTDSGANWECMYFSLTCLEKIAPNRPLSQFMSEELWGASLECLIHAHPWVKLKSARVIHLQLQDAAHTGGIATVEGRSYLSNSMKITVKHLCSQFKVKDEEFVDGVAELSVKSLCLILPWIESHPHLFVEKRTEDDQVANKKVGEDDDDDAVAMHPVEILIKRLSNIAKQKMMKRRMSVFKCFAAFLSTHKEIVVPHIAVMLEPIHRTIVESTNELENAANATRRNPTVSAAVEGQAEFAQDLLQLVEDSCESPQQFLDAYSIVKQRARNKREKRKLDFRSELVRDPILATRKKQGKYERDKKRRKRRAHEAKTGFRRRHPPQR